MLSRGVKRAASSALTRSGMRFRRRRAGLVRGRARGFSQSAIRGPIRYLPKQKNVLFWKGESFMPEVFYTSFRTSEDWAETTAGGFAHYAWKANSLFDPDAALGGQTPVGFTNMTNIYGRYNVISATIVCEYVNNDSDDPVWVVLYPSRDSAGIAVANRQAVCGQPRAKHALITNQSGAGNVINYQMTKEMFGRNNSDDIDLSAAYNADPTSIWYWHLYIFNRSGNALAGVPRVSITQYCKLFGLRNTAFVYA